MSLFPDVGISYPNGLSFLFILSRVRISVQEIFVTLATMNIYIFSTRTLEEGASWDFFIPNLI